MLEALLNLFAGSQARRRDGTKASPSWQGGATHLTSKGSSLFGSPWTLALGFGEASGSEAPRTSDCSHTGLRHLEYISNSSSFSPNHEQIQKRHACTVRGSSGHVSKRNTTGSQSRLYCSAALVLESLHVSTMSRVAAFTPHYPRPCPRHSLLSGSRPHEHSLPTLCRIPTKHGVFDELCHLVFDSRPQRRDSLVYQRQSRGLSHNSTGRKPHRPCRFLSRH